MDRRITFRFYRVVRAPGGRLNFSDAVIQIGAIARPADREQQLGEDYYVRAEVVESARGSIHGEFTRIQKTNYPSEVSETGRRPLRIRNPLGHGIVFRYLPTTDHLGLQYDPRVISPGRIAEYLREMVDGARFEFQPIVRQDMWEKFNQGIVRKISISVAGPTNLTAMDRGGAQSIVRSFRDMGEAYEAPTITIDLSMGHQSGGLSERIKAMVRHFRAQAVQDQVEISSMKARVRQEGEGTEDLDLLEDILSVRDRLELSVNDPEANYRVKLSALRDQMHAWL
ncbi:hypothetical protein G8O24_03325 [Bradyrhizobium sp. INPA01-394B]|uniref:Uncharacterized protein n=1 Tax=Bradyrhizobium campsiandrae TaxID=1729892 RepID=A0ABR7U931_9BRAD|nr:DUF6731 family protein [Bradyrhizobium campsiandrae]MBC9876375.1 hypothetical protein [Bradyrhizobium campsiandrae]MBC9980100.1 hypothetical protein [Bradyrhizobium campsiandrae]